MDRWRILFSVLPPLPVTTTIVTFWRGDQKIRHVPLGFLGVTRFARFFPWRFSRQMTFLQMFFVEKKGLCLGCFPYGSLTQIQRTFFGVTSKDVTRSKYTEKIRNQSLMSLRCLGLFFWCGGLFNIGRKEGLKIHGNLSSFFFGCCLRVTSTSQTLMLPAPQ